MGFETAICFFSFFHFLIWTLSLWDLKPGKPFWLIRIGTIWTLSLWDLKRKDFIAESRGLVFELCPYGIWNNLQQWQTSMLQKIWTLSLWDLKLFHLLRVCILIVNLNFVPMGFETFLILWKIAPNFNLNFVPMGFETFHLETVSRVASVFELCPYGIWNSQYESRTFKQTAFELCPYGIWNLLLEKRTMWGLNIWTLSLWDLKLYPCITQSVRFAYLNFVPMGFETNSSEWRKVRAIHLNFVPMGFETFIAF